MLQQYPIVDEGTGLVRIGPIGTAFPSVVDGLRALGLDVSGPSYARYGPPVTSLTDLKDVLRTLNASGASATLVQTVSLRALDDDAFCAWLLRIAVDLESMPTQLVSSVQQKLNQ
jgi:hypothetical protein